MYVRHTGYKKSSSLEFQLSFHCVEIDLKIVHLFVVGGQKVDAQFVVKNLRSCETAANSVLSSMHNEVSQLSM